MARTKQIMFTVLVLSNKDKDGVEMVSCHTESELNTFLGDKDLSTIRIFHGEPITVQKSVTFTIGTSKKRGRPAGKPANGSAPGKRGPGRPKGSVTKAATTDNAAPKRRGRPPKNQTAVANLLLAAANNPSSV